MGASRLQSKLIKATSQRWITGVAKPFPPNQSLPYTV